MARTYKALPPGSLVPTGIPQRWVAAGYVKLRWRIGRGQYVETYEHRVVDGRITMAEHVHHRNNVRADNATENLSPLPELDHHAQHASYDIDEAIQLRSAGMKYWEIAERFGVNPTSVLRRFQRRGFVSAKPRGRRILKTHCVHGHELTEENIYRYGNHRRCRQCTSRLRKAARRAKHP